MPYRLCQHSPSADGFEFKAIEISLHTQFAIGMRYHCFRSHPRPDHLTYLVPNTPRTPFPGVPTAKNAVKTTSSGSREAHKE